MTKKEAYKINNREGLDLAIIEITPEDIGIKGVIQFHSGTVIKKEFYLKYGTFLATQGYIVFLFDYYGVGESKPAKLRGSAASISLWGVIDAPAVTDWIKEKHPTLPIDLVAHSMGGQILGLMDNWSVFDKIILIASSSGNWNNFKPSLKRKVQLSTNLFFPICLNLFGYVPGMFGLGQDWPRGVATEWWQNSKANQLMATNLKMWNKQTQFTNINKSIDALFFSDDPMATSLTIPNIALSYPNAIVRTHLYHPKDFGLEEIGHFGIFKSYNQDKLGHLVLDLLSTSQ